MTQNPTTLASGFVATAGRFPDRPALAVAGEELTYSELLARARAIAAELAAAGDDDGPPLTAVLGGRAPGTFAGILGVLLRGHGYVPINPRYPAARNRDILERSGVRAVVVDAEHAAAARAAIDGLHRPPALVDAAAPERSAADFAEPPKDAPAYLLFTSGSTGRPKGVLVTHANVRAFLSAVAERYDFDESDRLSQLFDLTFDLSVFDLFVAWEHGACVCCPADGQLLEPSRYVRDARLTVWFSVPSVAMLMRRLGALKPNAFPELRLSLFCGEALPAELAAAWSEAAPSSGLENLYGPTEATVACTAQTWPPPRVSNGLVPIGKPFGETITRIVDTDLAEVPAGEAGQLLLAGPQVVGGYLDDAAATEQAFLTVPGVGRGYLTGDRVRQPEAGAPLEYLGRLDSQIKVLGHRVELGEVEAVLRDEARADAVALGWPRTPSGAAGIVAFVADPSLDRIALRRSLSARLPDYMVPRELHLVDELPLNVNGKHDRGALVALLQAG